ncbi:MAG: hypothetical protein ACHQF2_06775 [Flavobacteriales bacterium]
MNSNKIGVWMDYSHAVFIDPYDSTPTFETVTALHSASQRIAGEKSSKTSFQPGQRSNNEYKVHQKENSDEKHYFKVMVDRLKQFDEIFVFGPTEAPHTLFLEMQKIQEFRKKKLSWEKADKMTDNQLLARVKKHFF